MVDAFGGAGPRLWRGKLARIRAQRWMMEHVEGVRRGTLQVGENTALHRMATYCGLDGELLDARTAVVEVLNVIRPTVAIAWYVTFAALALHEHPEARHKLANYPICGDSAGEYADLFMQEVRRFYPFTPYLGVLVRAAFDWRGHRFERGTLVLLDVYGMHHDPRLSESPEAFRPERFRTWQGDPYNFTPQGGGSPNRGHRCPGEWLTMHALTLALHVLVRGTTYDVTPDRDLSFSLNRMPTRPKSGLRIGNVQLTPMLDGPTPTAPSATAARSVATAETEGRVGAAALRD